MNAKEILTEQLNATYDQDHWFVTIKNAVSGLSVEHAAWKPDDSVNCIWEILSHITYYNNAYLQRFKGIDFQYDISTNDETFSTGEYTEADWQADVAKFDAVMSEWRELLSAADDAKLDSIVSDGKTGKWKLVIADILLHNAYHGGQILLMRKLQGAWNAEKGVS